ncbi:hypothetical protein D0A37_16870 [Microcoleus vaginatus HSN003]|nr:hypothetical protein D0A37_16870 [Microcoleus vaginatus HSN003]
MAASFVLVGVTAPPPSQEVSVALPAPTDPLVSSQTAKPSPLLAVQTPKPETVKTPTPTPKPAISAATPALAKPEPRKLPSSVKSVERTAEIAIDAQQPKEDTKKVIYESSKPKVKSADFPSCVNSDCNCSDFTTQDEAQRVLEAYPGDRFKLDRDKDSIACETLP